MTEEATFPKSDINELISGERESRRVNGCPDEAPFYDMPWAEGPGVCVFTEEWCEACVEEDPRTTIEDGEVVWDTSDNDYVPLDEVRASNIDGLMNEQELVEAHEGDDD